MPAPTTTTSVPGEPRTRDRIPGRNCNCPSRRSLTGPRFCSFAKAIVQACRYLAVALDETREPRRRIGPPLDPRGEHFGAAADSPAWRGTQDREPLAPAVPRPAAC